MKRFEIQQIIGAALTNALIDANVPLDGAHVRRLHRALLRAAARIGIDHSMPAPAFTAVALEAFASEATTSHPAALVIKNPPPEHLN